MGKRKKRHRCRACGKKYGRRSHSRPYLCSKTCAVVQRIRAELERDPREMDGLFLRTDLPLMNQMLQGGVLTRQTLRRAAKLMRDEFKR